MRIRLAAADVSALDVEKCLALVGEARRRKVLRLRSEGARRQSLGAGLLAKMLLEEAGLSEEMLSFSQDAPGRLAGKPVLPAETGCFISLSHAGRIAVCALADAPAGVDAEEERRVHKALLNREFSPADAGKVNGSDDPSRAFLRLWTAKESLFKASGLWAGPDRPIGCTAKENGFVFSFAELEGPPRAFICLCARGQEDAAARYYTFREDGRCGREQQLVLERGEP